MTTTGEQKPQFAEAVYLGRRLTAGGKLAHAFIMPRVLLEVDQSEPAIRAELLNKMTSVFEVPRKSVWPALVIGAIYHLQATVDGNSIARAAVNNREHLRSAEHADQAIWESLDAIAATKHRKAQLLKRQQRDTAFERAVRPLRELYHRMPYADRPAFEAVVLDALRQRKK